MDNKGLKIIETKDGSHTLYDPVLNETYHSRHGALTESKYVFIEKGLEFALDTLSPKELKILEVGFGTGLNCLLTALYIYDKNIMVNYNCLDPYPVDSGTIKKLNYPFILSDYHQDVQKLFLSLHEDNWNSEISCSPNFRFTKYKVKIEGFSFLEFYFDLVYYDAFAPSKQSEIWNQSNLEKIYHMMREGGILVTYCAQGKFKRDLISTGFELETIEGPPGKKEMVRAIR